MTYMHRIGKTYYARIVVPKDLQPILGCTEFKKSLKTKNFKEAKQLLLLVLDNWSSTFFQLRYTKMAKRQHSKKEIEIWLKQNPGKSWVPDSLRQYDPFRPMFNSSQIIRAYLDAGYEPDENGNFDTSVPPQNDAAIYQQSQSSNIPLPIATKDSIAVIQAIEEYLNSEEVKALSGLGRSSSQEVYRTRLKKLSDYTGNQPLEEVNDHAFLYHFYNTVIRSHKLSYRKAIESATTQMLKFHFNRKRLTAPVPEVKIIESTTEKFERKSQTANQSYSSEALQLLFNSFAEKPAKRISNNEQRYNHITAIYGSILALYTGHRISDLSHLRASDFDFSATIPSLLQENQLLVATAPDGTRIAKMTNKTSNTLCIPLHKQLLSIGLQKFIALFKSDEKPFEIHSTITQRLSAQLKAAGIKQPGQLAHSFRATLDNKHVAAGTPHDLKEIMMGHAIAGTAKHYTDPAFISKCELPKLNTYVQKIDFEIDLSILNTHLKEQLNLLRSHSKQ